MSPAHWAVIRQFCASADCAQLENDALAFFAHHRTRENVVSRRVFVCEDRERGASYAAAINVPGCPKSSVLPSIVTLPDSLLKLSRQVVGKLSLAVGRTLFNCQCYALPSEGIVPHHDGEWLRLPGSPMGARILRPRHIAILTLRNERREWGTSVYSLGGDLLGTVKTEPGDLLILDNHATQHGLESKNGSSSSVVRTILGWRSMDCNCLLVENDSCPRPLSLSECTSVHLEFLREEWPRMQEIELAQFERSRIV